MMTRPSIYKATVQSSGNAKNVDQKRFSHLHHVPKRDGVLNFLVGVSCVGDLRKGSDVNGTR